MQYEYFYGAQAEQFSFYRIPKALFTEPNFRELSTDAKVLYGILLDRMSLSLKNQWFLRHFSALFSHSLRHFSQLTMVRAVCAALHSFQFSFPTCTHAVCRADCIPVLQP